MTSTFAPLQTSTSSSSSSATQAPPPPPPQSSSSSSSSVYHQHQHHHMPTFAASNNGGGGGGGNHKSGQSATNGSKMIMQLACVKFVPQAFNPSKCQQCFNFKELHSADALAEYSKVYIYNQNMNNTSAINLNVSFLSLYGSQSQRRVCKYGYLFIAPPDIEPTKTKRWQWRFFILYDDSELTYSLDENVCVPHLDLFLAHCGVVIQLVNIFVVVVVVVACYSRSHFHKAASTSQCVRT